LALLWENWRLTYLAFFVALLVGAGVIHSLSEMHRLQPDSVYDPVLPSYAICWFALLLYGAIVLYSLADPKALSMRIPSRQYCLPMRTGTMVAVHLAYRVASFSLLAVALFVLMRIEFGKLVDRSIVSDMAIAVTIFSYVLAVAWSWGAVRPLITVVLVVALPILAIGVALKTNAMQQYSRMNVASPRPSLPSQPGMTFIGREDGGRLAASEVHTPRRASRIAAATEGRRIESEPSRRTWIAQILERVKVAGMLGLYLLAAVYLAVAYVSGVRGRMGSIASERSEGIATRIFGSGPRITSSAQQAQLWYEWRRKGLVLPGLTLCFTIAAVIFAWIAEGTNLGVTDLAEAFLLVPAYASVFAAFFTGLYMLSVDYRHASSGLSTFLYTRPLSTDAYARARLRMSVQSVLVNLSLCLALGIAGIALLGVDGQRVRPSEITALENLPLVILVLVTYGLLLWSLLWMSVPVLVYLLWFGCYFYYQSLVNAEFARVHEHVHMFWLIWIPAVALVAVTAIVWRHPTMWRSLSSSTVARARNVMVLAMLAMGLFVFAGDAFHPFGPGAFESLSILFAIVGLSMLPALSILSQPLLLDRLRRR